MTGPLHSLADRSSVERRRWAMFRDARAGRGWVAEKFTTRPKLAAARLARAESAREDFADFCQLLMPDAAEPANPTKSGYDVARHHEIMIYALELVEAGAIRKLIINMPPRHGKSQTATKLFPAWRAGRNPRASTLVATYNQDFADDIGREVRGLLDSPAYPLVFPEMKIDPRSRSVSRMSTTLGGQLFFVGTGGALTGRGGDLLLVDDPVKDAEEAASSTMREALWKWFNSVFLTRAMTDKAPVVLIQTRWNEDDLTGRLTDPSNPLHNPYEAKQWTVLDMPALCDDPATDLMGRAEGDALWPRRFGKAHLEGVRARDPLGFSALYQGRPSPPDGVLFKAESINLYSYAQLPKDLRIYAASDHAVSTDQRRDKTCFVMAGVDDKGDMYILPEIYWEAAATDQTVEAFLRLIKKYQPLIWWAEGGAIGKAIGPFLRKRMQESNVHCAIHEAKPVTDKWARAQAIHARVSTGRVFFPGFAPWWPRAREELLKFPTGTHDDFVDALAHLGRGLLQMTGAGRKAEPEPSGPKAGTIGWVKASGARSGPAARTFGGW